MNFAALGWAGGGNFMHAFLFIAEFFVQLFEAALAKDLLLGLLLDFL